MAGRIELSGMTVNPPKGHGTDPLLSLGNLVLDVVPTSLLSDVIVVEELTLKSMSLNLVRDKQGRLGLAELVKTEKPVAQKPDAPSKEKALPVAMHGKNVTRKENSATKSANRNERDRNRWDCRLNKCWKFIDAATSSIFSQVGFLSK